MGEADEVNLGAREKSGISPPRDSGLGKEVLGCMAQRELRGDGVGRGFLGVSLFSSSLWEGEGWAGLGAAGKQ